MLALAIYAMLANAGVDGPKYGGGAQAPLWYFLVVGIQALTLTFPFSQAMSVTRREFYLGTLLTAALTSAILAGIFVVGGFIEQRHRRLGHERLVLRTAVDLGGRWLGAAAAQLRRRRCCSSSSDSGRRRSTSGSVRSADGRAGRHRRAAGRRRCGSSDDWMPGPQVFGWFATRGRRRPVAVGPVLDRGARRRSRSSRCGARFPDAPSRMRSSSVEASHRPSTG